MATLTTTYSISSVTHPEYDIWIDDWFKWRLSYVGGFPFIHRYLQQYTTRENVDDFNARLKTAYCPSFAKVAINEIKNSVFQHLSEIIRRDGPQSYHQAVEGLLGGVDMSGAKMGDFLGRKVLPELLVMQRVGIFVDMPQITGPTIRDKGNKRPYLYIYEAEDIRSWAYSEPGSESEFKQVLLADHIYGLDSIYGLPVDKLDRFRLFSIGDDGFVHLKYFDKSGVQIDLNGQTSEEDIVLNLRKIPFTLLQIPHSLMKDVADYQIALLNLESSDMNYIMKANFPFYVEQYDPKFDPQYTKAPAALTNVQNLGLPTQNQTNPGQSSTVDTSRPDEIRVGPTQGRRYPKDMNPPSFIHPSSEPILASMAKGKQLKEDIRLLVHLSLSELDPQMASAESKSVDNAQLEAGLSFLGLVLESAERKIAEYWSEYEGSKDVATIKYPTSYRLMVDADRRTEAADLVLLKDQIPSQTFKKEISKRISHVLLASKVGLDILDTIDIEIDDAKSVNSDPNDISMDLQNGLVSDETASSARGWPAGEVEQARKDRAAKIAQTMEAQGGESGPARGTPEMGLPPTSSGEKVGKPKRGVQQKP